jgi:hypothetical protein
MVDRSYRSDLRRKNGYISIFAQPTDLNDVFMVDKALRSIAYRPEMPSFAVAHTLHSRDAGLPEDWMR